MTKNSHKNVSLKKAKFLLWGGIILGVSMFCLAIPLLIIQLICLLVSPPIFLDVLGVPLYLIIDIVSVLMSTGTLMIIFGKVYFNRAYAIKLMKEISLDLFFISDKYVLAKKGEIFLFVYSYGIFILKMQDLGLITSQRIRLPLWYGIRSHKKIDNVPLFNINRIISIPINETQYGQGLAIGFLTGYRLRYPIKTPETLLKIIEEVQNKEQNSRMD